MLQHRVIPTLLLKGKGLVKGVRFKNHVYVGDPINTVQLFNAKEVDELLFLDITATREGRIPSPETIQAISDQCLMPFSVGGGISTLEQIGTLLRAGAEKVCINTATARNPGLLQEAVRHFGRQSIILSVDVKKNWWNKGYHLRSHCGGKSIPGEWLENILRLVDEGAGEVLLTSIDRDGTMQGYDLDLIRMVTARVKVPVIACGGAGSISHLRAGIEQGAAAVAAGSMFVFHGPRRAVLVSYPDPAELAELHQLRPYG